MLRYVRGDLLMAPQLVIAHGCNCRGVMGAGVALAIRRRYPLAYTEYLRWHREGKLVPGDVQVVLVSPTRWVANCFTQDGYGRSGVYARPAWIESSLRELIHLLQIEGIAEFAMPKIGCNLGGLNWQRDVEPIVRRLASETDIWVYSL